MTNSFSAKRTGNFSQAGTAAANDAIRSYAAARRNAPKFGEMAEKMREIKAEERIAGMKTGADFVKEGIRAVTQTKLDKIEVDNAMTKFDAKRKAGSLAAIGNFASNLGIGIGDLKRASKPIDTFDDGIDLTSQIDAYNAEGSKIEAEMEGLKNQPLGDGSTYQDPAASTTDNTGGTGSSSTSKTGADTSTVATAKPPVSAGGEFKFTPVQAKGAALVRSVESDAYGGYDAFNLGGSDGGHTAHGSGNSAKGEGPFGGRAVTSMTIGELEDLQDAGQLHAVGGYQFIRGSLREARETAGLSRDAIFSPSNQDKMYQMWGSRYNDPGKWIGTKYLQPHEIDAIYAGWRS